MSGRVHVGKDHRKLLKKARAEGWRVTQTKKNHVKWQSPKGEVVISSSSPSDQSSMKNFISEMRNAGMDI